MQTAIASLSLLVFMLLQSCLSQRKNRETIPIENGSRSSEPSGPRENRELSEIRINEGDDLHALTEKIGRSIDEQGLKQPQETYFILHSSTNQDLRLHGGLWTAFTDRFRKNIDSANGLPVLSKSQVETVKKSRYDVKNQKGTIILEKPTNNIPAGNKNKKKVRFADEEVDLRQRYLDQKSYLEKKLGRSGERFIHINGLTVLRSPKDLKSLLKDAKKGESFIVYIPMKGNKEIPLTTSDLKNITLERWGSKGLRIFVDNRGPAVSAYPFKLSISS